jgi:amino acid adenylation domain-containing protein/thioester reductase-like protein
MPTIADCLDHHAQLTPDGPAVICGDETLSYGQLMFRATEVMRDLARAGVGRGDVVLIRMPRCAALCVAIVAALKTNAAYVIQDTDGARSVAPMRDLVAATLVRDSGGQVCCLVAVRDEHGADVVRQSPDPVAYVVFTSGSTGQPKGVAVTQRNLAHYCAAIEARLEVSKPLCCAHVSSLEADLGNTSIFLAWWTGGTLALATDAERRDPSRLTGWLATRQVDLLKITPSHWAAILPLRQAADASDPPLRHLVLGGEALSLDLARRTLETGRVDALWNHYGPTETTIGVAAARILDADSLRAAGHSTAPLGAPLGLTQFLVEDEQGRLGERSCEGELLIGGPAVGAGYLEGGLGPPAFIRLPGRRGLFYRTGDVVRVDASGAAEFLGRRDRQVKLNGYRTDLQGLEVRIRALLGAEAVACWLSEDSPRPRLLAAVTRPAGEGSERDLRQRLAEGLGPGPIPARIQVVHAWPLTANGKTDYVALQEMATPRRAEGQAKEQETPLAAGATFEALAEAAWREQLFCEEVGPDDNFFDLGGDSLDAIRLIGRLQAVGVPVTASAFLAAPTLRGIADAVRASAQRPVVGHGLPAARLSPALEAWMRAPGIVEPAHACQVIALEIEPGLKLGRLKLAINSVAAAHPMLQARLDRSAGRWRRRSGAQVIAVGRSRLPADPADARRALARESEALQRSLAPERGRNILLRLFEAAAGRDTLLLVAHHAVIDAISWRILLDELFAQLEAPTPGPLTEVAELERLDAWVGEGCQRTRELHAERTAYLATAATTLGTLPLPPGGPFLESSVRSCWFRLTPSQTSRLKSLGAGRGLHLGSVLLAGVYSAHCRLAESIPLWIDVEGHGRARAESALDVSSCLGWFTVTVPLALAAHDGAEGALEAVARGMGAVPAAVQEFGLSPDDIAASGLAAPMASFNFLGEFKLPWSPSHQPAFSTAFPGAARGGRNARPYATVITGRLLNGALVVDLAFSSTAISEAQAERLAGALQQALFEWLGDREEAKGPLVAGANSSGLLAYSPAGLEPQAGVLEPATYGTVLLTGATGYLGAHLLHELLSQSEAEIHCLVRGPNAATAQARLRDAYVWYHSEEAWRANAHRVVVILGDLTLADLGLSQEVADRLRKKVQAIYHCAADVRLVAPVQALNATNVDGLQRLIQFAESAGRIDLHHVSTLAVAGVGSTRATFDETSFDVGQEFRNPYEATKHRGEWLVRQYGLSGGRIVIYRTGNLAAHSRTGRFQRNADENQFVQLLRGLTKLGRRPAAEPGLIVLSPVDIVAQGIVKLSADPRLDGTVHVDSPHVLPLATIFDCLGQHLTHVQPSPGSTLRDVFDDPAAKGVDSDLEVSGFWVNRQAQTVTFNHDRTLSLLAAHRVVFPRPDSAWLDAFIGGLLGRGLLREAPLPRAPDATAAERARAIPEGPP